MAVNIGRGHSGMDGQTGTGLNGRISHGGTTIHHGNETNNWDEFDLTLPEILPEEVLGWLLLRPAPARLSTQVDRARIHRRSKQAKQQFQKGCRKRWLHQVVEELNSCADSKNWGRFYWLLRRVGVVVRGTSAEGRADFSPAQLVVMRCRLVNKSKMMLLWN